MTLENFILKDVGVRLTIRPADAPQANAGFKPSNGNFMVIEELAHPFYYA
jgi:hypothetical protein